MRLGSGARVVFAALAVAAIGFAAVALLDSRSASDPSTGVASRAAGEAPARGEREPVGAERGPETEADEFGRWAARTLERAVDDASRRAGGTVQGAVMLDGWVEPLVVASEGSAEQRPMRMWSIAKVVTAVALLRELGWESPASRRAPSRDAAEAMRDALVRSENCRQRRMVLGLQELTGGPGGAQVALREVLDSAGADADLDVDIEAPESLCLDYLATQQGSIPDPYVPTLLLGTATWRIADMVRFLHALGSGAYGDAIERRLISLMRAPKGRSREVPSGDFTADLDWGAGNALAGLYPAYKAGWGGTLQGAFMAAQGAVVQLADGDTMVFAVAFHPNAQPAKDDPGLTEGPAAIEGVMGSLAGELLEAGPSSDEGAPG